MHARVSTFTGPADKLDELVRGLDRSRSDLQTLTGFQGGYALVDRNSGKALTITLWDSEQAAQSSAEAANRIRGKVAEESSQAIQSVETYEVALRL
jgi:heme-degrading monooxygenase HmoA